MKTLGKLRINSEKMLKNEELVNLKGGGYPGQTGSLICCYSWDTYLGNVFAGYSNNANPLLVGI